MDSKVKQQDAFQIIANYTSELESDSFNPLGAYSMVARSDVPISHVKIADNFMLIKKLFGFSAIHSKINFEERKLLSEYDFNLLEFSTAAQVNNEIILLKKWSESKEPQYTEIAEKIMQIRAKELKYIIYTNYREISNPIYTGYKALERYFEVITKY